MSKSVAKFPPLAILTCLLLVSLALCAQENPDQAHGIQLSSIDHSVRPGDDFYDFANGDWIKKTEIPPDRVSVGVFATLFDLATKRTTDLISDLAKSNPPAGSETRKVADLYNSYMDEAALEKRGLAPIKPLLDGVRAIKDKHALAHALGESLHADVDALNNTNFHTPNLFGLWVAGGFEDSDHYHPYLLQGGLQLPDREYYLSDSPAMRDLRTKYQTHVAAMLKLAGFDDADARATRIIELEHSIAEKHRTLADNDDIRRANNHWTPADFASKAPGLDWKEYFSGAQLSSQKSFIVWQPEAFTGESALVASAPLETWKDWLAFHMIEQYAGALPKALSDERFAFFGKALSGAAEQRPRWQRAVFLVNGLLGDAVGKVYAQKYFSPQAKATAQAMVTNLIQAFHKRIDALPWMAASTKKEANAKLDSLYVGIGYPEKWRDYSKFEVKPDDLFGNLRRAEVFDYQYQIGRLGKPVDRHEWSMTPQTVNAVNLPLQNALNFPAAILEAPFFDAQAPAAANYGAIGTVIGHEISHTFDTEGSTFDAKGRLRNWWTDADLEHFKAATQALAKQYDQYHPFPDLAVNGQQTLAENIADCAGISAALDGYHAALAGKQAPEQGGYNGDQQFFIAYAQNWSSKTRPAALRQQVMTDVHAPGEYRSAEVRNIDDWYTSFNVKPDAKLYLAPDARVRIW